MRCVSDSSQFECDIEVTALPDHFRKRENILPDHAIGQTVRNAVHDSEIVFVGTDTNESRIAIEELCRQDLHTEYLSCGIHVDEDGSYFECSWGGVTPRARQHDEGYGPDNASYISIVTEAVSVAFSMLLHHLKHPESATFTISGSTTLVSHPSEQRLTEDPTAIHLSRVVSKPVCVFASDAAVYDRDEVAVQ